MIRRTLAPLFCSAWLGTAVLAQDPTPAAAGTEASEILSLSKKIDQQNLKIDLLSQQILRLQQEIEHPKADGPDHTIPTATAVSSPLPADANTHVVAKGETLTSIAKQHKVTIDELQKLNHIENDRKLQIGQTLVIPGSATPASATSASPSPNATAPNE
ncbi:MAG: LysM peptidoglycan-binding domain-containing protein [Chthoniobacterales bacterium]